MFRAIRSGDIQFTFLSLVTFSTSILFLFSPSPTLGALCLLFLTLSCSMLIPSESMNARFLYSFSFISVGLVLYLLARGTFTDNSISKLDFFIVVACYLVVAHFFFFSGKRIMGSNIRSLGLPLLAGSSGMLIVVAFAAYLKQKGIGFFLAWTASGDSRNHVQAIYDYALRGDLSVRDLGSTPLARVLATFLNSGSTVDIGSNSMARLQSDLVSYTTTWIILISVLGIGFAAIWEIVLVRTGRYPRSINWVLLSISTLSVSSFALGGFLQGGFITGLLGVIALVLATIFLLDNFEFKPTINLALIVTCLIVGFLSWPIVVIAISLMILPKVFKWLSLTSKSSTKYFRVLLVVVSTVAVCLVYWRIYAPTMSEVLNFPGSTVTFSNSVFYLLLSLVLLCSSMSLGKNKSLMFSFLFVLTSASLSMFLLLEMSESDMNSKPYYLAKYLVILCIALAPTALAFIHLGYSDVMQGTETKLMKLSNASIAVSLVIALHYFSEIVSPVPNIWKLINSGWIQPSADTITLAISLPNDPSNPTVLFKYRPDDPGATRLGDFWLGTYATPREPFQSWSYVGNQEGDIKGFCALNEGYAKMTVLTRDPNLSTRMFANCPDEDVDIRFIQ